MAEETHEGARRRARRAEQPAEQPAEQAAAAPPAAGARPTFGLTEGERADLQLHGVTRSAFGDGLLFADDYGIEPSTPAARDKLERHRRASMPAESAESDG